MLRDCNSSGIHHCFQHTQRIYHNGETGSRNHRRHKQDGQSRRTGSNGRDRPQFGLRTGCFVTQPLSRYCAQHTFSVGTFPWKGNRQREKIYNYFIRLHDRPSAFRLVEHSYESTSKRNDCPPFILFRSRRERWAPQPIPTHPQARGCNENLRQRITILSTRKHKSLLSVSTCKTLWSRPMWRTVSW